MLYLVSAYCAVCIIQYGVAQHRGKQWSYTEQRLCACNWRLCVIQIFQLILSLPSSYSGTRSSFSPTSPLLCGRMIPVCQSQPKLTIECSLTQQIKADQTSHHTSLKDFQHVFSLWLSGVALVGQNSYILTHKWFIVEIPDSKMLC